MQASIPDKRDILALEQKLQHQQDARQRLFLLDQLIAYYAFTDAARAERLLIEQDKLLNQEALPDFVLNLWLHRAFVQNQLYQFDESAESYKYAIELVDERGDVKQQAAVYIDYAGVCINKMQLEQAETWLSRARRLLKVFPDRALEGRILCREGYLYLHFSNYSKAIEHFLEADKMLQSDKGPQGFMDSYFLLLVHSGLGKVYGHNNDWDKSAEAYRKVVSMSEQLNMRTRSSWYYLNAGTGFMMLGDDINAEHYLQKAIDAPDDTSQQARASAQANLGYLRFQQERHPEALALFEEAEIFYRSKEEEDHYNLSNIERWRAELYLRDGVSDKAMAHFVQALHHARLVEDYKQISGVYKDIASFYASMKDFKSAYEYQQLYEQFAEKYLEQVNIRKVLELEVKYEAEQRRQEAEVLRLQATRLQLKALRAQMNPHFMFNALNAIQNYITSNNVKYAAKYLAKFAGLMRKSLEFSDQEIISLEEEIEFLRDYLDINQKLRFDNQLVYEIHIDDEIEEDIMGVPTMIIQPYVENAIEHGLRPNGQGKITLRFVLEDEDTILCIVEDDGIGRERAGQLRENDPKGRNHRSRGTSITEKRLQVLNTQQATENHVQTIDLIDPDSGKPLGTRVEIRIPVVEVQMKRRSSDS